MSIEIAGDHFDLMKKINEQRIEIEIMADFHEWLVDVYMDDGTTLPELWEHFEKYNTQSKTVTNG